METSRGSRIEDRGSRIEDRGSRAKWMTRPSIFYVRSSTLDPRSSILDLLFSILSICALLCAAAQAQSPPAQSAPTIKDSAARVTEALAVASHLVAEILAIEDSAARVAALRKFLETNNASEQVQAAREAAVTRWAQLAESALGQNDIERGMENYRRAVAAMPGRGADRFFEETVIRIPFALSARGYRDEAIEIARELERQFAKEPPRLASLGEFYMTVEAAGDAI